MLDIFSEVRLNSNIFENETLIYLCVFVCMSSLYKNIRGVEKLVGYLFICGM